MGKAGSAFLFLLPSEMPFVEHLESSGSTVNQQALQPLLQALPVPETMPQVGTAALPYQPLTAHRSGLPNALPYL